MPDNAGGSATPPGRISLILLALPAVAIAAGLWQTLPLVFEEGQILNTGVVLLFLCVFLAYDFRPQRREQLQWSFSGWSYFAASVVAGALGWWLAHPLVAAALFLIALTLLLRAAGSVWLSPDSAPLQNALLAAAVVFGLAILVFPAFDIPLRFLAGGWSAQALELLRQDVGLGMMNHAGEAMLILVVNGKPFHVAAECNGFGLFSALLVLTLAIIVYRRISLLDGLLLLISAVFLAVAGNIVRILVIVFLAPKVGDHYMLMHEIVGTAAFYLFIGAQFWLIIGFGRPPRRQA